MLKHTLAYKALPAALLALGLALPAAAQMPPPSNSSSASSDAGAPTTTNSSPDYATSARTSGARQASPGKLSHAERKFIETAAKDGMAEVELARIAKERASNEEVRKFAERMEQDHGKANEELRQLAQQKGVTVPAGPAASEHHEANKLAKLQGDRFDREYMKHMVKDHKKDLKEFEKEAGKAKDADVRAFASRTLPTLQEHMQLAQNANQAVNGAKSGKSSGSKARDKTALR